MLILSVEFSRIFCSGQNRLLTEPYKYLLSELGSCFISWWPGEQHLSSSLHRLRDCVDHKQQSCRLQPAQKSMQQMLHLKGMEIRQVVYFCGFIMSQRALISTGDKRLSTVIMYQDRHRIHVSCFKLHTKWSYRCKDYGLKLVDKNTQRYCGKILPWTKITDSSKVQFVLYGHREYADVVLLLFYHLTDLRRHDARAVVPGPFPLHLKIHLKSKTVLPMVHIMADFGQDLVLLAFPAHIAFRKIKVHDGPGPKSPKINFIFHRLKNELVYRSLAFQIFVILRMFGNFTVTFLVGDAYEHHQKYDAFVVKDRLLHLKMRRGSRRNFHFMNVYKANTLKFLPVIQMRMFLFRGPTVLNETVDNSCQYGGLYVTPVYSESRQNHTAQTGVNRRKLATGDVIRYCSNLNTDVPPFIFPNSSGVVITALIYTGYSYGEMLIDIRQFNKCNFKLFECSNSMQPITQQIHIYSYCENIYMRPNKTCSISVRNHPDFSWIPSEVFITAVNSPDEDKVRPSRQGFNCTINVQPFEGLKMNKTVSMKSRQKLNDIIFTRSNPVIYNRHLLSLIHMSVNIDECEHMLYYRIEIDQYVCPGHQLAGINATLIKPGCWTYFNTINRLMYYFLPRVQKGHIKITPLMCNDTCLSMEVTLKYVTSDVSDNVHHLVNRIWMLKNTTDIYYNNIPYPAVIEIKTRTTCPGDHCPVIVEMPEEDISGTSSQEQNTSMLQHDQLIFASCP